MAAELRFMVAITHIRTKINTETKNSIPETGGQSDINSHKIQDGGSRHFEFFHKTQKLSRQLRYIHEIW